MKLITIEKKIPVFDELISKFQLIYPDKPCIIAGGAVRDIMLNVKPKDIDIFFLGLDWSKVIKKEFVDKLKSKEIYYEIATSNLPWHKYERYLLLTIIWKTCQELKDIEIQFCGFPVNNLEDLLKTFDWEICLFGYSNGIVTTTQESLNLINKIQSYKKGDKDYKPPKMKLYNVQFPISNLRRGFKFENRYPIKLDYNAILKLCANVLKENFK